MSVSKCSTRTPKPIAADYSHRINLQRWFYPFRLLRPLPVACFCCYRYNKQLTAGAAFLLLLYQRCVKRRPCTALCSGLSRYRQPLAGSGSASPRPHQALPPLRRSPAGLTAFFVRRVDSSGYPCDAVRGCTTELSPAWEPRRHERRNTEATVTISF